MKNYLIAFIKILLCNPTGKNEVKIIKIILSPPSIRKKKNVLVSHQENKKIYYCLLFGGIVVALVSKCKSPFCEMPSLTW